MKKERDRNRELEKEIEFLRSTIQKKDNQYQELYDENIDKDRVIEEVKHALLVHKGNIRGFYTIIVF